MGTSDRTPETNDDNTSTKDTAKQSTVELLKECFQDAKKPAITELMKRGIVWGVAAMLTLLGWLAYSYNLPAVAMRMLPTQITTGTIPKPEDIAAAEARKKAEAECITRRDKEVAVLTQQRIATWAEYQACKNEPRLFSNADVVCKPKGDRYLDFTRKSTEAQARDCTAAK